MQHDTGRTSSNGAQAWAAIPGRPTKRNKVITADEAARVVLDRDTVATGGFVGIGFPEEMALALERRFLETGAPAGLTLVYAGGQGDGKTRGLNHFGHPGMVSRVIGGHWGLVPALGKLALDDQIEAYCFPQGVISHLFREIAGHKPGVITPIGLHTFVDPRVEGGRMNARTTRELVKVIELEGQEYLFFPSFPISVALLRGTTADEEGNVTMEREALTLESLAMAQAAKNSGGIVIVQVERVTVERTLHPKAVQIPGILVDAVVIAQPEHHQQTFAGGYNPAFTGEIKIGRTSLAALPLDLRKVIARRAAMFLKTNAVVNLGIGMPEGVAAVANEEGILDMITLTVEPGGIGGIPASGLSFGAVANAEAIIDQPAQFDFYDGGGLDQAFLGMAEVDADGNVNVSRFGSRLSGAGGFINISQTAKAVYFMGTFMPHSQAVVGDGRLTIVQDHAGTKFVSTLGQITFSGAYARERKQTVYYVTERCVFRLAEAGLDLVEIAPGVDLQHDVLDHMEFRPLVHDPLAIMDSRIFSDAIMDLQHRSALSLSERLYHNAAENLAYVNFEGLNIETIEDARRLAEFLDRAFSSYGHKVNVIVNYDNFNLNPVAAGVFFAMVKHNRQEYFESSTRYSSNAFFRHQLGEKFASADLAQTIYHTLEAAKQGL